MVDLTRLCEKQIHGLASYFRRQHDSLLRLDDLEPDNRYESSKMQRWSEKALHGRHANDLSQPHIDAAASNAWLSRADIFAETEGFMLAIQDQVIATRNYLKYIVKANVEDDLCRRCMKAPETIQHITGACQELAGLEYTHRHNTVAKIVHQQLAHMHGLVRDVIPHYRYTPSPVLGSDDCTLYWDRSILTDKTIPHNRPDIVLKRGKETYLIDIGVPNTHNLQSYYREKIVKYMSLAEEVRVLWKQDRVTILPLMISATGVVPDSLNKNLRQLNITDKARNLMQKTAILSTCSIVRSHLNLK